MPPTFDAKTSTETNGSAVTSRTLNHTGTGPLLYAKATLVTRFTIGKKLVLVVVFMVGQRQQGF